MGMLSRLISARRKRLETECARAGEAVAELLSALVRSPQLPHLGLDPQQWAVLENLCSYRMLAGCQSSFGVLDAGFTCERFIPEPYIGSGIEVFWGMRTGRILRGFVAGRYGADQVGEINFIVAEPGMSPKAFLHELGVRGGDIACSFTAGRERARVEQRIAEGEHVSLQYLRMAQMGGRDLYACNTARTTLPAGWVTSNAAGE